MLESGFTQLLNEECCQTEGVQTDTTMEFLACEDDCYTDPCHSGDSCY